MKNRIWQEDNEYYKLEPLTEELVKEAEEKLNIKLPQSYIHILKEQNGGYIKFDAYPTSVPTSWADDHIEVDHLMGIGEENGILESAYLIDEWGLPNDIVLLSGNGHSWVALDYRNTKEEPAVIWIDVDNEQIIELASNFDSFLNGLTIWEDDV
ncbi:SMI1/KNR4 family protein [Bacillus sp. 1P06AnD]|uniref:SMI1/KNR4 family protein n=1 Tax=Bacillus sp. 1P06AnD TaxID=3132208 RepID=UPI0039A37EFB